MKDHAKQGDVLATLRRLMSDDAKVPRRPGKDKLVLTEALRVEHAHDFGKRIEKRPASDVERMARELLQRPAEQMSVEPKNKTSANLLIDVKAALGSQLNDRHDLQLIKTIQQNQKKPADHADSAKGSPVAATVEEKVARIAQILNSQIKDDQNDAAYPIGSNVIRLVHSMDSPAGKTVTEDGLREIVAEVVRDELKGKLGEQISTSIRKLIRREIQRSKTD